MNDFEFVGQRPGEKVELVIRTHPMKFLVPSLKIALVMLVPIALYLFLGASLYSGIFGVLFLFVAIYGFTRMWYEYTNGIGLITNLRVLVIEQNSFWKRQISEANLDKIQEVTNQTRGFIQTTFNFGNVYMQTASSTSRIELKNIPRPYQIQQEITKRITG